MLQITREADCAIRILLEVASQRDGESATTATIAGRRLVPRPFLRKIVPRLVAAGLLSSARGRTGGIQLRRAPDTITLLDILAAVGPPITINRCVLRPDLCPLQPTCPVHEICRTAHGQITRLFGDTTLAQLARRADELGDAGAALERPA